MPVEFTKTANQIINFGLVPALHNLDQKTVIIRFNLDAWPAADVTLRLIDKSGGSAKGWTIDLNNFAGFPEEITFTHAFTGTNGFWLSDDNSIAVATNYHFAVTYDRTSVVNDPILYLNGSPINVTETSTPTGSTDDDSAEDFAIGNTADGAGGFPHDGKEWDISVYNKILTPAEVLEDADSDVFVIPSRGLVFHLPLLGSDGKKAFTGVLSNTNFVYDYMGGVKGTPANSPIAHPETEMAFP